MPDPTPPEMPSREGTVSPDVQQSSPQRRPADLRRGLLPALAASDRSAASPELAVAHTVSDFVLIAEIARTVPEVDSGYAYRFLEPLAQVLRGSDYQFRTQANILEKLIKPHQHFVLGALQMLVPQFRGTMEDSEEERASRFENIGMNTSLPADIVHSVITIRDEDTTEAGNAIETWRMERDSALSKIKGEHPLRDAEIEKKLESVKARSAGLFGYTFSSSLSASDAQQKPVTPFPTIDALLNEVARAIHHLAGLKGDSLEDRSTNHQIALKIYNWIGENAEVSQFVHYLLDCKREKTGRSFLEKYPLVVGAGAVQLPRDRLLVKDDIPKDWITTRGGHCGGSRVSFHYRSYKFGTVMFIGNESPMD